jgi:hypothetical protein
MGCYSRAGKHMLEAQGLSKLRVTACRENQVKVFWGEVFYIPYTIGRESAYYRYTQMQCELNLALGLCV